ncbi:hypothetical protein NHG33_07990 [Aerococcaceae bacterium NML130460]|nr:hypothetical protein [Aerococcaceae bacterium NML130460]
MKKLGIERNFSVESISKFIMLVLSLTLLGGVIVIMLCQILYQKDYSDSFQMSNIPKSFYSIFLNNFLCYLLFMVPYFSPINYALSMFFVHVYVGIAIVEVGVIATFSKLLHYVVEIGAFGTALYISYCLSTVKILSLNKKKMFQLMSIGVMMLLIASIIEINLK